MQRLPHPARLALLLVLLLLASALSAAAPAAEGMPAPVAATNPSLGSRSSQVEAAAAAAGPAASAAAPAPRAARVALASPPAAKDKKKQEPSVPGQAFHDWKDAIIARNFSSAVQLPLQQQQQQHQHQKQPEWVRIVGIRDTLPDLPGPPPVNTTHPAAAGRLAAARAALARQRLRLSRQRAAAEALLRSMQSASVSTVAAAAAAGRAVKAASGSLLVSWDAAAAEQQLLEPWLQHPSKSSSSSSSGHNDELPSPAAAASDEQLELTLMSYVRKGRGAALSVNGQPWLLSGFDLPQALSLAVGGPAARRQLLQLMDQARRLNYNTLRIWAFGDGSPEFGSAVDGQEGAEVGGAAAAQMRRRRRQQEQQLQQQLLLGSAAGVQPAVLQPFPGILNAMVLREGLGWVVQQAGLRGLRLVLVLTNGGSTAGGGAKQFTDWVDSSLTLSDFYTNDTCKSVFLDYLGGVLSATTTSSGGLPLREDPVVAAWQLGDGLTHPGRPASEQLLAWLRQMGRFVKEKAPNQLLLSGVGGYFGPNSPHHLADNPPAAVFDPAGRTPHAYDAACHGSDFWLHNQPPEFDVVAAPVLPDAWLACDSRSGFCQTAWLQAWTRSHLRDALRLQKPLILGPVGALLPHNHRQDVLRVVRQELQRALSRGHPVAGVLLSGLSLPGQPGGTLSSWAAFPGSAEADRQQQPARPLSMTQQALYDVVWRRYSEHDAFLACLAAQEQTSKAGWGGSGDQGSSSGSTAAATSNAVVQPAGNEPVATAADGWEGVVVEVKGVGALLAAAAVDSAEPQAGRQQQRRRREQAPAAA